VYEGVSKTFRTGLEWELQTIHLSATRCSCMAILWVSLVSFAAITLCVASPVYIVVAYFFFDSVRKLLDIPSYTAWHRRDCDLLHDRPDLSTGRTHHDKQNRNRLNYNQYLVMNPGGAERHDRQTDRLTDWLTDWLTNRPPVDSVTHVTQLTLRWT
jgi:hypothetical protein